MEEVVDEEIRAERFKDQLRKIRERMLRDFDCGTLYDVTRMLETAGHIHLSGCDRAGFDDLRRLMSLVASHALKPLVEELQDERCQAIIAIEVEKV